MSDTLVQESAARLFADLATPALINAAEAGTFPAELWDAVEKAGFTDALAAAAEQPGDLAGIADAAAILREAGRFAVPLPLAETMLARWLLAGAGIDPPDGPLTFLPVDRGANLVLRREQRGWRLSGRVAGVPWGRDARAVVALAEGEVTLVSRLSIDLHSGKNLAGEPRDDLSVDAAVDLAKPAPSGVDAKLLHRMGALTRSILMAGALEEVLRITVQYANDRAQFGRPIGKFQAIQQQLAVLAENVAAAGVIAAAAVEAAAGSGDFPFTVAAAKSRVGEAAGKVAETAHQVHGAIGFTHEHRLHHLTRRLWSWRDEFGVESEWSLELGRIVASRGGDGLWPLLTGSANP